MSDLDEVKAIEDALAEARRRLALIDVARQALVRPPWWRRWGLWWL